MQPQPLERRIERLEQRVTVLGELPGRIDRLELQFVQLREEMRGEFSALRGESLAGDEQTRREMRDLFGQLKGEMSRLHEEVTAHMLTLYEDIVSKFALFGEAQAAAGRKGGRKRR
jgi:hypothetical protein